MFSPLIDVIFPSAPDESKALFGYERPLDVIGFLWDRGVSIVVVKIGANGCMIGYDGKVEEFKQQEHRYCQRPYPYRQCFQRRFHPLRGQRVRSFTAAQFANSVALFKGLKGGGSSVTSAAGDLAHD